MSIRRLIATAAVMTLLAVGLAELTPGVAQLTRALAAPQRTADTLGPDAVVAAMAGVAAWAVWAWGALGLALTAGSALPGLLGAVSRGVLHVVVPAGARHSAAVLLGLGVGVAAPLLPVVLPGAGPLPAAAAPAGEPVPDWPVSTGHDPVADWPQAPSAVPAAGPAVPTAAPAPDWPGAVPAGAHVVVRGDCLWHIAEARLAADRGTAPSAGEVTAAVDAWWTANSDVIGPDPDLLLPGQVLQPPDAP